MPSRSRGAPSGTMQCLIRSGWRGVVVVVTLAIAACIDPVDCMTLRASNVPLYPDGPPGSVAAMTAPTFESRIGAGVGIDDVIEGYSAAENVSFGFRRINAVLSGGTTLGDLFTVVAPTTGDITVFHPHAAIGSEISVEIYITDSATLAELVLTEWNYTVVSDTTTRLERSGVPFILSLDGTALDASSLPSQVTIGTPYRFIAPSNTNTYFQSAQGRLTYQFVWISGSSVPPDGDVLINPNSGTIMIQPTTSYNVTYMLMAHDSRRQAVSVLSWTFVACPVGHNCEVLDTSGSSDSNSDSDRDDIILYAVIGAIVAVSLIVLIVALLRSMAMRRRPANMSAVQDEILASLGTSIAVAPDELGLTLHFGSSVFKYAESDKNGALAEQWSEALLMSLRTLTGLPSRLTAMLRDKSTTVRVDPADSTAFVLLKPSKMHDLKPGTDMQFAAALNRYALARKIVVDREHYVHTVSVTVCKRVPDELNRRDVVRLGDLGEGHYAEVYKASVQDAGGSNAALTVAVKTLKTPDSRARAELLREAALMALFDHKNVVGVIGVVTAPRRLPALLVLEFCEHGTLLDHVMTQEHDSTVLLTFCHDVASGMHYLASRNIVHGDVAARNVLVDAARTCKVSDFGKSMALSNTTDVSEYSSVYVKLRREAEVPVRWAAIEVLADAKYSKASDVWAFGVLIYEVMSGGALPYAEFPTLTATAEQIKGGYTLKCPTNCSPLVHARAMQPCWNPDAVRRPGFAALCDILVDLGAAPNEDINGFDDVNVDARSVSSKGKTTSVEVAVVESDESKTEAEWRKDFDDRPLLGLSVYHIGHVLAPQVVAAVHAPWVDDNGNSVDPPESATVGHGVQAVVRPAGLTVVSPRDGQVGCAYVDTLVDQDHVGRAVALLSYTWSYKMLSVAAALTRWTHRVGRNPKRAYIWMCSLCLNQHRTDHTTMSPDDLARQFGPRIQAIGRLLPMLEPWRSPSYLTRAWCLFELYTAIGEQGAVEIDILLTDEQHQSFLNAMTTEGYGCIDAAFASIRSQDAKATRENDLLAIRTLVQSKPGGFNSLNNTVRHYLERWFVGQGAVRSALWVDEKLKSGGRRRSLRRTSSSKARLASQRASPALGATHAQAPVQPASSVGIDEEDEEDYSSTAMQRRGSNASNYDGFGGNVGTNDDDVADPAADATAQRGQSSTYNGFSDDTTAEAVRRGSSDYNGFGAETTDNASRPRSTSSDFDGFGADGPEEDADVGMEPVLAI